ncbi:spore coat protein [Neobacillus sp. 179-C4.2 HS]|uniref:Spore coat protein n=1 Tax=Neobacillus driksii TaxID=3035913 RepID=A0ABV4YSZ8_9BACI|nr:spore coat protein [Neobacillus sp. 179.-C4.2 HS]MDP5194177.1 spore coat protein [Neobacillus sp. 179.-C4.2 HS]
MNQFIQNMVGMGGMTDQVIANDFLMSAKSGIRNYTIAITEAATPELRTVLREQLQAAIQTHENITSYMISKGYYHPHNLREQLQVDLTASQTATNLAQQ